jgi:thiol-disulfide isomerase/thioredoxin
MSPPASSPQSSLERIGAEAFDVTKLRRNGTWAIAFIADWCPFCRTFLPEFSALSARGLKLVIADLTDEDSPLWETFEIEVVPSVIVFRDGDPLFRVDGRLMEGLGPKDLARVATAAAPR